LAKLRAWRDNQARQQRLVNESLTRERTVEIKRLLSELFTMEDMKSLAFDMNINHESIVGLSPDEWSRELVLYCEKRGLLNPLIQRCQELRPNAPWPVL